jgi:multiple sugar transport system ATP-binding protein
VNLFVAGFIGSPAMNFMPAQVEGDRLKLPMAEVRVSQGAGLDGGRTLIAGIRPEDFDEVSRVGGGLRERGATFRAKIEVLETVGSEVYAHFSIGAGQQVESQELRELAEDAGAADVPRASGEAEAVARLDPETDIREGQEAELWFDPARLHLFDAETGRALTSGHG